MLIATLIAAGRLDDRVVAAALDRVPGARFDRWVDKGDAADFIIDGDPLQTRRAMEMIAGVDVAVQEAPRPAYRVFVADMDSTIIGQECIDELADYAGVRAEVAGVTERAMAGQLDFKAALAERVGLLKGLDVAVLGKCLRERIHHNPGAATLVATLNHLEVQTSLVSGGFSDFVRPIARQLGFQDFSANELGVAGGKLNGMTNGRIVDAEAKRAYALERILRESSRPLEMVAIGDGANDIPMVEMAGLGIGYNPKPALEAIANATIRNHDLTAVLWMMGIPKSRWVRR